MTPLGFKETEDNHPLHRGNNSAYSMSKLYTKANGDLVIPEMHELEEYFTLKFGSKQVESGHMIFGLAMELAEAVGPCWRDACNGIQSAGLLKDEGKEFTLHKPIDKHDPFITNLFWQLKCDTCGSIRAHPRDWIQWIWHDGSPCVLRDAGDSLHWTANGTLNGLCQKVA